MASEEEKRREQECEARLDRLLQRYPKMLRKHPRKMHGYVIDPGWADIYEELCARVDALLEENARRYFHFVQFKEKFGRLCAYYRTRATSDETMPRISAFVEEAELRASRTCQVCGAPGTLRRTRRGVYLTACDQHLEEQQEYEDSMDPKNSKRQT